MQRPPVQKLLSSILRYRFAEAWNAICPPSNTRPLGLAVSGGVDSMALARLCSEERSKRHLDIHIYGFIVDHGVRQGSDQEARHVANALRKLDILPEILQISWDGVIYDQHFESAARAKRYHVLGNACRQKDISKLLVAHHANDVAETVMMNILHGFYGRGLQGIKSSNPIPECDGMYGVHESGSPSPIIKPYFGNKPRFSSQAILPESGGVTIVRPLLGFTKDSLTRLCEETRTPWFEDVTNNDLNLTVRNTIRDLLARDRLPLALRQRSLYAMANRVTQVQSELENEALQIFNDCDIQLDTRIPVVKVRWPFRSIVEDAQNRAVIRGAKDDEFVTDRRLLRRLAFFFRMLLRLVAPVKHIDLQSLVFVAQRILARSALAPLNAAGCCLTPESSYEGSDAWSVMIIRRSRPPRRQLQYLKLNFNLPERFLPKTPIWSWTDFKLWDGRYWIRIGCLNPASRKESSQLTFEVGFLTEDILAEIRIRALQATTPMSLDRCLRRAKNFTAFTTPVIAVIDNTRPNHKEYVALPTLGWANTDARSGTWALITDGSHPSGPSQDSAVKHWVCEVRYRKLNLDIEGGKHLIV